ncbi:Ig-like domain-containing protein [Capilliphycus salinus ALCB114379]|uniref:Ig-like domain-containing protein n=1 Tax=Capilliphycus salinus TaxID=2768948 RepID=UPI0039A52DE1
MIEINGTPGNDNLLGTGEADVIFALTGNDRISGSSGGDSLFGFEGNDTINGNEGNDTLFGNQNLDLLFGDSGEDWLFGGKEADIIEDGEGEDQVFGNLGDDLLRGGAGNDQRYGGQANDTVIGGIGNDEVFGDRGNDILWGVDVDAVNPGIDEIDTLTGGSEQDIFVLGDESRLYYIGFGNNDFALITDFNVVEDQINVGNNQVIYAETVLNELGFGVAISSQNNDLIAFVQNANVSQFLESSNVVEPPQTEEVIPRQIEEPEFPEVVLSPDPVVTPTPTPDPVVTPTPTPDPVVTPTPTPDPVVTPTPTPDPVTPPTPTPTPDPAFTPTPDPVTPPTPTPDPVTPPTPTPDPVTPPTPTPDPVTPPTPTPTPDREPQPNTPPVADNDNYSTGFQSPITVDAVSGVLNGDTDIDRNPLTAILVNSPTNGSVSLNENGSFSYSPNSEFSGVDSFTYTANDGEYNSNIATVTIDVEPRPNTPPVADNDNYITGFQSPITVDAVVGILNGDTDAEGDPITAILVNSPANGSVSLNENGSFSYTPNSGFSGVDSFTYTANDGESNSNIATVTINVEYSRSVNGYSQRGNDDETIFTTFFLTDVGSNGQVIVDQTVDENGNDSDTELGLFPEAIQNFIIYKNSVSVTSSGRSINFDGETELFEEGSNVTLSFNEEGEPIFTGLDAGVNIETEIIPAVDLRVRLIERDDIITELEQTDFSGNPITDEDGNPITKVDESFQGQIIVYEFFESGTETPPLAELVLFTNEFSDQSDIADLATNSLESIIKQNLLAFTVNKEDAIDVILEPSEGRSGFSFNFISLEKAEPPLLFEQAYSYKDIDDEDIVETVLTTFLLTNNGNDDQIIVDQTLDDNGNDSDPNLGLFPEAVRDFITYNNGSGIQLANLGDRIDFNGETELEEGATLSFDEEGKPIFTGVEVATEITPVVDLRVTLIPEDQINELEIIDELNNSIVEIDESLPGEIIIYEFLESGTENVIEELFLFTDELSFIPDIANLATNSLESIENDFLRFTFKKSDAIKVLLGEVTPGDARSTLGQINEG